MTRRPADDRRANGAAGWNRLAYDVALERTVVSLTANALHTTLVPDGETARRKVLALLADGVNVVNVTLTTPDHLGLSKDIEDATRFESVRRWIQALPQSDLRLQPVGHRGCRIGSV